MEDKVEDRAVRMEDRVEEDLGDDLDVDME